MIRERHVEERREIRGSEINLGERPKRLLCMAMAHDDQAQDGQLKAQLGERSEKVSPGASGTLGLTN